MVANTYTQIHIQAVFAVQHRYAIIQDSWKIRLHKYISAIVENNEHKLLAIDGMPDHVHVFFGMRPSQSISDLLQDIKGCSTKWINENRLVRGRFSWQEGYGAFSYSKSDVPRVIDYVKNQAQHHRTTAFLDEYEDLLKEFGVQYDTRYIFKPLI